jgi:hypothetical protein
MENQRIDPGEFELDHNYPNPFNPTTVISYEVPRRSFVSIKIYDSAGREIQTLVNQVHTAGKYEAKFNAANLASGVYYYRMKTGKFTKTRKLLFLK